MDKATAYTETPCDIFRAKYPRNFTLYAAETPDTPCFLIEMRFGVSPRDNTFHVRRNRVHVNVCRCARGRVRDEPDDTCCARWREDWHLFPVRFPPIFRRDTGVCFYRICRPGCYIAAARISTAFNNDGVLGLKGTPRNVGRIQLTAR